MEIVVVGSVALDSIHTPHASRERLLGGSASYFSLAARHLGSVGVVACVGDDFPSEHSTLLEARGIDLLGLARCTGATFCWEGEYSADLMQRRSLRTELGVFESFEPQIPSTYRHAQALFLANIDPELQLHVLEQLPGMPLVAVDTMNFWIEGCRALVEQVIARTHVLLVNDEEAELLTGISEVSRAAPQIRHMGPEVVVIKKGTHGAAALGPWGWLLFPALPLAEVEDTTGAGDSFAGGLVGYLASRSWRDREAFAEGLAVATAMASLVVESFGVTAIATDRREELISRCALLRDAMRFDAPAIP
ncbi:MAG: sugar kinase [Candidatus Eisenbacteria bacterium]|nr:sugar kinase [Candidatus Eisenbacteria bacterium]